MPNTALYVIGNNGIYGFINATGDVVIPPAFIYASTFSEGVAKVEVSGLTYEDRLFGRNASGFIDQQGHFIIGPGSPARYTFTGRNDYLYGDFHEGLAKFWIGDASGFGGYIDRSGEIVIEPQFDSIGNFSEGLASASVQGKRKWFGPSTSGFIDRDGRFVFMLRRKCIASSFSEGFCVTRYQDSECKWQSGVIDRKGDTVIQVGEYDAISDFVDGIACVRKNQKSGYIDKQGKLFIPFDFDLLYEFEHSVLTTAKKAEKWFFIDRTGECHSEVQYRKEFSLGRFKSGFARITSDGKHGYVREDGEVAIPLSFDQAEGFEGEVALVSRDMYKGYINKCGEFVWKTDCWDAKQ